MVLSARTLVAFVSRAGAAMNVSAANGVCDAVEMSTVIPFVAAPHGACGVDTRSEAGLFGGLRSLRNDNWPSVFAVGAAFPRNISEWLF